MIYDVHTEILAIISTLSSEQCQQVLAFILSLYNAENQDIL